MMEKSVTLTTGLLAVMSIITFLSGADSLAKERRNFDKLLTRDGVNFHVTCPNNSSLNKVKIIVSGLTVINPVLELEADGSVFGAETADLNRDGSPEIYIYVNSAGSGSYGSLIAYSSNNNKSLSEIYLPPLKAYPECSKGYMGHDEFAVLEDTLARRFPVYKEGDSNANPTGGMRQLQYKLIPGEAGWILKLIECKNF